MKMNKKIAIKLTVIALLLGIIGTFTHCVPQIAKEIGDGGGVERDRIETPADPGDKSEGQIINELQIGRAHV